MSSKKKLTLSVDEAVIERARRYSTRHNTRLVATVHVDGGGPRLWTDGGGRPTAGRSA